MNSVQVQISWVLIGVALVALLLLFGIVDHQEHNFKKALQQEFALRNTFSRSDVAAVFVDSDQIVTFVTPGFTTMLGYSARDIVGKNIREIMSEKCRVTHEREYLKVGSGERNAISFSCWVKTCKGGEINMSNTVLLFGTGGGLSILTPFGEGPSIDLTIASLRGAKLGVWWWDAVQDRFVCDDSIVTFLGLVPPRAVLKLNEFVTFLDPTKRDDLLDAIKESRQLGRLFRVSVIVRTAKGERVARIIGRAFSDGDRHMASGIMFETDDVLETKYAP